MPASSLQNVKLYFRIGFNNKEILSLSAHEHGVVISIMALKRLCLYFWKEKPTLLEELAAFV